MTLRPSALFVLLSCLLPLASLAQTPMGPSCPAARVAPIVLAHVRAILARNHELLIVALGSSSTVSWRASDIGHSYPALLQAALGEMLPAAHVAVINRGIGGQGAAQELARLDSDVIPIRPQLVIWQVGANDVLKAADPVAFHATVLAGVEHLQQAGIDVVLMDNQRAPRILAQPGHALIDQAVAEAAAQTGAPLFARSALMDEWRAAGLPYADFISPDHLHHNDLGYRCVAEALAQAIHDGVQPGSPQTRASANILLTSPAQAPL